jgi:outer membrane immunogenic protein
MKKLLLSLTALTAIGAGSALAADMPVKAVYKAPPVVYAWTGCYIGGNVGGAWSHTNTTRISADGVGLAPANYGTEDDSGVIYGGQIGCDFQFSPVWVIGIQGQFDFSNINGRHNLTDFPTFSQSNNLRNFETATFRIGYLVQPQLLAYVKGGIAWARNDNSIFQPTGALSESASINMVGGTVGGGLEWMFMSNWSAFVEYKYMKFDTTSQHFIAPVGLVPPGEVLNFSQSISTVMVGLNWRLGWSEPVYAKY